MLKPERIKSGRDVKGNKQSLCRYVGDKRKTWENVDSLWKEMGNLVTWDMEKAEVLSHVSDSAFMASCSSHTAQAAGGKGREWENKEPPTGGEDWGQEGLRDLKVHKSMGPDKMHPRVHRDCWRKWLSHCPSDLRNCGIPETFPLMPKGETIPLF